MDCGYKSEYEYEIFIFSLQFSSTNLFFALDHLLFSKHFESKKDIIKFATADFQRQNPVVVLSRSRSQF